MTNPSVTDQVAEVAGWLEHVQFGLNGDTTPEAYAKAQYAARLIATLAAEVEARRKQPRPRHVSGECLACDIVQLTRATDALLAEVKR